MYSFRAILILSLFVSVTIATPIERRSHLRTARALQELYPRVDLQALSQPITFKTVTTSQTSAGTITQTCNVTLSPVTAADGSTQTREDKQCKLEVGSAGGSSSSSSSSNGNGGETTSTSTTAAESQATQTATNTASSASSSAAGTNVPAISEIGVTQIPAASTGTVSPSGSSAATQTSASVSATATASGSAPPAVSVIGTGQVSNTATGTALGASASSGTTPVTSITTLPNGSVSTSISTPSAAAAQEAQASTPGQKLEVLPIGLGVFAGVSVIALIVVGLVTYERTKYRKAFRQRKLAEAGANMGYGGMAERT